jgi:hypothetical protein
LYTELVRLEEMPSTDFTFLCNWPRTDYQPDDSKNKKSLMKGRGYN